MSWVAALHESDGWTVYISKELNFFSKMAGGTMYPIRANSPRASEAIAASMVKVEKLCFGYPPDDFQDLKEIIESL